MSKSLKGHGEEPLSEIDIMVENRIEKARSQKYRARHQRLSVRDPNIFVPPTTLSPEIPPR